MSESVGCSTNLKWLHNLQLQTDSAQLLFHLLTVYIFSFMSINSCNPVIVLTLTHSHPVEVTRSQFMARRIYHLWISIWFWLVGFILFSLRSYFSFETNFENKNLIGCNWIQCSVLFSSNEYKCRNNLIRKTIFEPAQYWQWWALHLLRNHFF